MSNATSGMPGARSPGLAARPIGPLAPCVLCGHPALCRSPVKDVPCHKGCAEAWITGHARDAAELARLIRAYTPGKAVRGERFPGHLPRAHLPRLRVIRHHQDRGGDR